MYTDKTAYIMKKTKFLISIISLIIISLLYFSCSDTSTLKGKHPDEIFNLKKDSIQFTIQTEFEEYLFHQDIWVKAKIYNNSKIPYLVNVPFTIGGVDFTIKDSDSLKYRSSGIFEYLSPDLQLSPGDSLVEIISLENFSTELFSGTGKKTGTFNIRGKYQGIQSNIITFTVTDPKGGDKLIFDELYGPYKHSTREEQYDYRLGVLEKYNDSQYGPQFYYALLQFSDSQSDLPIFREMFQKCFSDYPNSYTQTRILDKYWFYLGMIMHLSQEQAIQELTLLKDKFKGTFIDKTLTENLKFKYRVDDK